jgi:hypothetical protein
VPRGDGSFIDPDDRSTYGTFDTFAAGSRPVARRDDARSSDPCGADRSAPRSI